MGTPRREGSLPRPFTWRAATAIEPGIFLLSMT